MYYDSFQITIKGHGHSKSISVPLLWIFAAALFCFITQAWAPEISGIPVQVLLVWVSFLWLFLFRPHSFIESLRIFTPLQWIVIIGLAGSILVRCGLDGWDMLRFAQVCTGIMIAMLGSIALRNIYGRKVIIKALVLGALVSSIFATLQYMDFAPWLWARSKYESAGYYTNGATGLEFTPVAYSYSILGITTTLVASLFVLRIKRVKLLPMPSSLQLIFSFILIVGLVVSNSRSGLLGLLMGLAITLIMAANSNFLHFHSHVTSNNNYSKIKIKAGLQRVFFNLLILAGLLIISGLIIFTFASRKTDLIQEVRLLETWRYYLPVIMANPIGLSGCADMIEAFDSIHTDDSFFALQSSEGKLLAPHNLILTTGVAFGPIAAVALIVLYGTILNAGRKRFSLLYLSSNYVEAFWVLILIAANISIIGHSWFHNASIAVGEMRNWIWLGMLTANSRNR
jgi:hypothetical protein